jgi:succinyl-diaminopimelate desuccinylase
MVAIRAKAAAFRLRGHLDVVPPAMAGARPVRTVIEIGCLCGRGAVDMKSAIAAFRGRRVTRRSNAGTTSLLITGDEEGYATYGTPRIIDWLKERRSGRT